jgi:chorismate--pyruvate lyase
MTKDNIEPQWQIKYNDVPALMGTWLFYKYSFMERLKQYGIKQPEIIVLKQDWEEPLLSESNQLSINSSDQALVREVLIKSAEGHWMMARTVFPKATLTGEERQFMEMKNQSLGSILFKYPDLQRSEFEIACLTRYTRWYQQISKMITLTVEPLWARRSIFTFQNKVILLSEVFLPDVFSLG